MISYRLAEERSGEKIIKHKDRENEKQSRGETSKLEINNKNLKH